MARTAWRSDYWLNFTCPADCRRGLRTVTIECMTPEQIIKFARRLLDGHLSPEQFAQMCSEEAPVAVTGDIGEARLDLDRRGCLGPVGGLLVKTVALMYAASYVLAVLVGLMVGGWFIWQHGLNGAMPALIDFYCQYSEVACAYFSVE